MRILLLNWKKRTHPQAGGAEIVTAAFIKELIARGHEVTWFSQGQGLSLYINAYVFYKKQQQSFDLVIDQIHGLPFFTPLYVKKPILAYIHEVAGIIWFKEFSPWIAPVGWLIEQVYFSLYRNTHFLTHSLSTKTELIQKGISAKQITIIQPARKIDKHSLPKKSKIPTLIYIGRFSAMKRVDLLLSAVAQIKNQIGQLQVYVCGDGKPDYINYLTGLIQKLQLESVIIVKIRVTEKLKYQLLAKSWLHIQPSIKEGFGLTVLESALCGTPTVCFNVAGLRDLVHDQTNGVIVTKQSSTTLAQTITALLRQPKTVKKLAAASHQWAKKWPPQEKQTQKLEKLLKRIVATRAVISPTKRN